jgi:hypothetical protein
MSFSPILGKSAGTMGFFSLSIFSLAFYFSISIAACLLSASSLSFLAITAFSAAIYIGVFYHPLPVFSNS